MGSAGHLTRSSSSTTGYTWGATLRGCANNMTSAQQAGAPDPGAGASYTSITSGHRSGGSP
jgi:hypothetical protein